MRRHESGAGSSSPRDARYQSYPGHSPYTSIERYDRPKEDHKTIARKLASLIDSGRAVRVVDLGCANGELLHLLRHRFPAWELHGFDITPEFIETAKDAPGLAGVRLEVGDLFDVEGCYDVVIACCLLSVFPDACQPLAKMLSICADGGVVLATGLFNPFDIEVRAEFRDATHPETRGEWRTEYNRPSQRSIRERFGAEVASIEFEPCPFEIDLPPRPDDPVRVWTVRDEHGNRLLVNGAGQILNQVLLTMQK